MIPALRPFLLTLAVAWSVARLAGAEPVRVLLVTGGHAYDTNEFHAVFERNPGIRVTHVVQPRAQEWFGAAKASAYDTIVLYDMWTPITPQAQTDLLARVREGKGLLATHHALCNYRDWPDYGRLIGGKYHFQKWTENGVEKPASSYKHDVQFKVKVVDPTHPVTRGVKDFEIHDETYLGFEVKPDVTPLLTTDDPTSTPTIAWARQEEKGRVVYLELGHDRKAYANPAYQQVLAQAIQWTAGRTP